MKMHKYSWKDHSNCFDFEVTFRVKTFHGSSFTDVTICCLCFALFW